uniref:CYtochrome P450 family n=1 Tax=Rhabditophanes sp. KR3021 TaxID=114890 RepID=A0AC35TUS4_9BILA
MLPLLIGLIVLSICLYIKKYYDNVANYPKGPMPLPFIGNFFDVPAVDMQDYFKKCSDKFGPVFTVFLPAPIVVLNDYESIKESMVKNAECFAGRPTAYPEKFYQMEDGKGVLFSSGENWKNQRRIAIQILRDFGFGNQVLENKIHDGIDDLFHHIDSIKHEGVDFRWPFQICVANVISSILFGYKCSYDNTDRLKVYTDVLDAATENFRASRYILLYQYFGKYPWIVKFLNLFATESVSQIKLVFESVRKDIAEAKKSYVEGHEPENFVHAYLDKCKALGGYISEDQLAPVVSDFWIAGMDTVTTFSRWSIVIFAYFPDVQTKMRDEIHAAIHDHHYVTMRDKKNLVYCTAVQLEIQRFINFFPINLSHEANEDISIMGHLIKKGTAVLPQIYNVLRYDDAFVKPEEFIPERFLTEDGKALDKAIVEKVIPFGLGKRRCAGEAMGNMEHFLIMTRFLQRYKVSFMNEEERDLSKIWGFILKPYKRLMRVEDCEY